MIPAKYAAPLVRVLSFILVALFSFFIIVAKLPESAFIETTLESVEESSDTVMKLSAATLATSLAISALPDDFASPLAETLTDMNIFFVAILAVLFLEKILVLYGVKLAFAIAIPFSCFLGAISTFSKNASIKGLALRICILGLTISLVVPCSTFVTHYVAADLTAYVEETIRETEAGADKLNEAMESDSSDKTIFENLSDLFQTAIHGVSDLMLHFQNITRRCMNSIAIMLLTNILMPLLTFFFIKWILKETFNLVIATPPMNRQQLEDFMSDRELSETLAGCGVGGDFDDEK